MNKREIIIGITTFVVTSLFWWATPFIAKAKGKAAAEGAKEALADAFGPSEEMKAERQKYLGYVQNDLPIIYNSNTNITITNNTPVAVESLSFKYETTRGYDLTGFIHFELSDERTPLACGEVRTMDIGISKKDKGAVFGDTKVQLSFVSFSDGTNVSVPK